MAKSNKTKLKLRFKFNPTNKDQVVFTIEDMEGGLYVQWPLDIAEGVFQKRLKIDFGVVEYLYDYFKSPEYEIVNLKCDDDVVEYLGYKPFIHWI